MGLEWAWNGPGYEAVLNSIAQQTSAEVSPLTSFHEHFTLVDVVCREIVFSYKLLVP